MRLSARIAVNILASAPSCNNGHFHEIRDKTSIPVTQRMYENLVSWGPNLVDRLSELYKIGTESLSRHNLAKHHTSQGF
jgi:hypothetical protein